MGFQDMAIFHRHIFLVGALFAATCASAAAPSPQEQAAHLLDLAGTTHGVACVFDCGDGVLATALAQQSAMVVLAVDARPARVTAAQQAALATGLLGRRLYVDVGTPAAIPLASDYADLLVVADLDDARLAKLPAADLVRVTSPRLGRIVLGGTGGKLSRPAIAAWLKANRLPEASISEDNKGLWAVIRKPAKPGAANWSNWQGGGDNNPFSADASYGYPDTLQYLNLPSQTGPGFAVAAGGRFFAGFQPDEGLVEFDGNTGLKTIPGPTMFAWQGYNGRLLWRRPVKDGFSHRIWVATDDVFYLPETNCIVALAADTGTELYRLPAGSGAERIIWLNVANGMGCVLTSTSASRALPESGDRLAVYDLTTKKMAWELREKTPVDYSSVATSEGRLVFCAPKSRVAMLDIKTGREMWSCDKVYVPEDGDNTKKPVPYTPVNTMLLCSTQAVVVLFGDEPTRMLALAREDGHLLWRKKRGVGQSNFALVKGRRLQSNNLPACFSCDLLTGGDPDTRGVNGGCGRCTAVSDFFVNQFGMLFDAATRKPLSGNTYAKPICAIGNFVANGLRYGGPPGSCRCGYDFRGFTAWNRADAATHPVAEEALIVADSAEPPVVAAAEADWTQYRRDASHASSSPVAVGRTAPAQKWLYQPPRPVQPTPSTAVAGLVMAADRDGRIFCLDAASGRTNWSFNASGRIFFQPTFADSRVYAGSADGRVYCLSAASGKLLWRFRPAPSADRLLVYNDLMSRWPVNGNIVVQDGMAFAVAGLIDCDGVYGCALNARSGKPLWVSDEAGRFAPGTREGHVPMGALALVGEQLWFRSDKGSPAAYDRKTGRMQETPADKGKKGAPHLLMGGDGSLGRDLGLFGGRYLLNGGARLFSEQSDRGVSLYTPCRAQAVDAEGRALLPAIAYRDRGVVFLPSWDRDLFVMPVRRAGAREPLHTLTAYGSANLLRSLDEMRGAGAKYFRPSPKLPDSLWKDCQHTVNAVVVCADAVLVAEGVQKDAKGPLFGEWRLTALDRTTGAELWHVVLPAEPVIDGITVDRDVRMLVAMTDGRIACYGK